MTKFPELFRPSPNCDRTGRHLREGAVFHHTVLNFEDTLARMLDPASRVSYHVLIATSGERCRMVEDENIAWHAGVSCFKGRQDCNQFLLGAAFVGNTYQAPLTEEQIESAVEWLGLRWSLYQWALDCLTDHRQISPQRKDDLNPVEWMRFARHFHDAFGHPGPLR